MTIGERIKHVRTLNKLSQEAFAKKIGIKGSAISLYESNERTVTETSIKSICREFQIDEEWLRTGKGKPEKDFDTVDQLITEMLADEDSAARQVFGLAAKKFTPQDWIDLLNLLKKLTGEK